jgi:hypothetical protein
MFEKKIMFSIRLNPSAIENLNKVSELKHLPMRTMIRSWIMERLEKELEVSEDG